ncbi:phosphatidylinositol 3 [Triplophysa rosa]|uniref:Phosphatidylinositol 3 n=1 Tax=Triplophysa rosa TaxID=992332 RepID=A0A9W7T488_TRIRA|nr:phosphatidylinositol 3 [Triplophysa rosa]
MEQIFTATAVHGSSLSTALGGGRVGKASDRVPPQTFDSNIIFLKSQFYWLALKALQDMSTSAPPISPLLSIRHNKTIPVQTFEVKLDVYLADLTKIGKSQKYSLSVDVEQGKLVVMKKMKDAQEDWNTFTHDKSERLSVFKREAFCQLLQLMKNKHSNQDEPDMISIFIGTWNMAITIFTLSAQASLRISKTRILTCTFSTVMQHCNMSETPTSNYLDILRQLSLGDKQLNSFDISLRFTHLFWFGDLNYRLDMDIQEILNYINRKEFEPLLKVDQLNLEREKNKVFLRFAEEEITYPPTYRYERGSRDTYVWQKQKATGMRTNVPSWCDRILWKSYPETHIVCNSYGCTDDIVSSDHSPVFGTFEVGVTSQFVSKKGLPKSSEQAYIEFENIEAIVKTASRTKFFIEFYSTCLEEFKKSYENDTQSSDNINFLRVGWSSKQLTTLKPILSDIEYLQDQHLLLTVKSLDGYESYGECVLALKSMIGSTAQQFHTYLSHRGEETGNIRGSMRVRVPSERMGTRERLYEWISVDKDEAAVSKSRTLHPRSGHEYVQVCSRKLGSADLSKVPEEGDKNITARHPNCDTQSRGKQDTFEGGAAKNSFNNPAYYILEGVPNQSAALACDMLPSSALPPASNKTSSPAGGVGKSKPPSGSSVQGRRQTCGRPVRPISEEGSSEDDGTHVGSLNRPPPDFPPPPLPKGALEMAENPFSKPRMFPDPADSKIPPASAVTSKLPSSSPSFVPPPGGGVAFCMETPSMLNAGPAPFRRGGGASGMDDQSCSVLQMAKTLSEVEYPSSRGALKGAAAPHLRGLTFPPRSIQEESIAEDLPEEGLWHAESSSSSLSADCSVGEWLQKLGLQDYEEGLLHNGWDDLEFLSDITEEDLEEAGVHDPTHKKILLTSLKQQK